MQVARTFRATAVAAALAALVVLAGCGSDETASPAERRPLDAAATTTAADGSTASSTTVVGSTTTAAADPVRAEVEAAYRNAVRVAEEAAMVPDPDSPALAEWNTGPMLEWWKEQITALKVSGRVVQFPTPSVRATAVTTFGLVDSSRAEFTTCEVDDARVVEVVSGTVVNDRTTSSTNSVVMVLESGTWKLSERSTQNVTEGTAC